MNGGRNIQRRKPEASRVSEQSVRSELMWQVRTLVASNRKQSGILNLGDLGRQWLTYRIEWEAGKWAETTALEMPENQKHLLGRTLPLGPWPWCPRLWCWTPRWPRTQWLGHHRGPCGCGWHRFSPALHSEGHVLWTTDPGDVLQGWSEAHAYTLTSEGRETVNGNVQILLWEGDLTSHQNTQDCGVCSMRRRHLCFPVTNEHVCH